jgi:flagellar basal body-associated protein FliL
MEEEDNSMEAILWVFLIAILIMSIAYYINYFMYNKQYILIPNKNYEKDASHTKSTYHPSYPDNTNNINNALENKKANPPPPKLVNLYNEDFKKMANKNDIDYVNKNNILLYNDNDMGKLMKENDNF